MGVTVWVCPVKRLAVCDELDRSSCGSLLFYCQIQPDVFESMNTSNGGGSGLAQDTGMPHLYSLHSASLMKNGQCVSMCVCVGEKPHKLVNAR